MRFLHFGSAIDEPHSWRQADTAHYIWDYYQNDIDLLEPSVCWMGGNDKVALEFPLPEAIAAIIQKIAGPDLRWSRLFFFLIYLAGAYYFYQILKLIGPELLAKLSLIIYLSLPLSIFYSRAIHVDFSAVLCAHAMLFHVLLAIRKESIPQFLIGILFASIGFLIKIPYLFYLAIPILAFTIQERKIGFLLRNAVLLLIPIGLFLIWQKHVKVLNGAMPDWSFIPSYHKMDDMNGWYFGHWENRFEWPLWKLLFDRLKFDVAAVTGLPILLLGVLIGWKRFANNFMRFWLLGTIIYLLIFFTLNIIHNYYQIPFLAPVSYFIALPIFVIAEKLRKVGNQFAIGIAVLATAVISIQSIRLTEGYQLSNAEKEHFGNFYKVNELIFDAGEMIQMHTPKDALVITTFGGLDCRCPNLLFSARRKGWSIPKQDISVDIVKNLQLAGATHFALLQVEPLSDDLEAYLDNFQEKNHPLVDRGNWKVRIFELK